MAGIKLDITATGIQTGVAAKTILQVGAPANQRGKLLGWSISFKGVTASDPPVRVRLLRQTSAGTFANVVTPAKHDPAYGETVQSTAHSSATAEPAAGDVIATRQVHPQGGSYTERFPYGDEVPIPGGKWVGIETLASVDIQCDADLWYEE